jgi:hypothetical protein
MCPNWEIIAVHLGVQQNKVKKNAIIFHLCIGQRSYRLYLTVYIDTLSSDFMFIEF